MDKSLQNIKRRPSPIEKFKINTKNFLNINEPIYAYILGLIWSDGSLGTFERSERVEFYQAYPDAEYFKVIFSRTGKWKICERPPRKINHKSSIVIYTYNHYLCEFLKQNDYCEKSKLSPDKILLKIPEKLHKYFYLGVIDGDGNWYQGKITGNCNFCIAGSYEQDWSFMINLCNKLGIKYVIRKATYTYKGFPRGKSSYFRISYKSGWLKLYYFLYNKNDNIGLPRKQKMASSLKLTKRDINTILELELKYENPEIYQVALKTKLLDWFKDSPELEQEVEKKLKELNLK